MWGYYEIKLTYMCQHLLEYVSQVNKTRLFDYDCFDYFLTLQTL